MKNHAIIKVFAAFNIDQLQCVSKLLKLLLTVFLLINGTIAFAQIGVQTNFPDASSALDIVSNDKGLLIPRVTLTANLGSPSPVTAPATGLLVFNSGANQPIGFYYWDGSQWSTLGGSSGDFWSLTGNAGTTVGTDFIGTTDNEDFAVFTNDLERMRVEEDGQVIIGSTAPQSSAVIFTVIANATQNYAMGAYSPNTGVYTASNHAGFYSNGGRYGLVSTLDSINGFTVWAKNYNADGWSIITTGSGGNANTLANHSAGLASTGDDGIFCKAGNSSGTGIIAGGNNVSTLSFLSSGTGGAFTGYHGIYGKGINSSGIGIVGVGSNGSTYSFINEGSGGSFTGYHGLYAKATNSSEGTGIIGVGNNSSTYTTISDGSGGAFTGYHGSISKATDATEGTGVVGIGNAGGFYLYNGGSGNTGSGGAFTGDWAGVAGWATEPNDNTIGVYGRYEGSGSYDGTGVYGISNATHPNKGYGVYGQGNNYGVFANGDLGASGAKSFAIDHPLDPENKILKHYAIESPEVLNMYRGMAVLDGSGYIEITLPDYFTAININFSYTLTPIGQQAPNLYIKKEIGNDGKFSIAGGHPDQKISWVVYAERNDLYMQKYKFKEQAEIEKDGDSKGKYIRPELYDQPPEKGIFYVNGGENRRSATMKSSMSVDIEESEVREEKAVDTHEFPGK